MSLIGMSGPTGSLGFFQDHDGKFRPVVAKFSPRESLMGESKTYFSDESKGHSCLMS